MAEKRIRAVQVKFPNFSAPYTYVTFDVLKTGDSVVVLTDRGLTIAEVVGHDEIYMLEHPENCKWIVQKVDLKAYAKLAARNVGALIPITQRRRKGRKRVVGKSPDLAAPFQKGPKREPGFDPYTSAADALLRQRQEEGKIGPLENALAKIRGTGTHAPDFNPNAPGPRPQRRKFRGAQSWSPRFSCRCTSSSWRSCWCDSSGGCVATRTLTLCSVCVPASLGLSSSVPRGPEEMTSCPAGAPSVLPS